MDSFLDFDFTSLLPNNEGAKVPSSYGLSDAVPSEFADFPVDAERPGAGLSNTLCVIS